MCESLVYNPKSSKERFDKQIMDMICTGDHDKISVLTKPPMCSTS